MITRRKNTSSKSAPESSEHTPSLLEAFTRFWVTVLVIAVILYAALLMISRTDGFKGLVRERIEKLVDIPLEIDQIHLSPRLNLIVNGLREDEAEGQPRLEVERCEIHWKLLSMLRGGGWPFHELKIDGCMLRFIGDGAGGWSPLPQLHDALAPWVIGPSDAVPPESGSGKEKIGLMEYLRRVEARVDFKAINIEWYRTGEDVPHSVINGASFRSAAFHPSDETVLWCTLEVGQAIRAGKPWLEKLSVEWIRMRDQDVILRTTANAFNMFK